MIVGYAEVVGCAVAQILVQEVPDVSVDPSVCAVVGVGHCRPVKLQQAFSLPLVNVPVVDPLDSLSLKAQEMLDGGLRMRVSEAVGGPAYFSDLSELFVEPVVANGILVNDVVDVAHGLVVFDPASVGDLQLSALNELLDLLPPLCREVLVPVLEEDYFRHEVFAEGVFQQALQH